MSATIDPGPGGPLITIFDDESVECEDRALKRYVETFMQLEVESGQYVPYWPPYWAARLCSVHPDWTVTRTSGGPVLKGHMY